MISPLMLEDDSNMSQEGEIGSREEIKWLLYLKASLSKWREGGANLEEWEYIYALTVDVRR